MIIEDARHLRDLVLQNDKIDPEAFQTFCLTNAIENLHLDFKSALVFTKNDVGAVVREYVAAFGNSDGGTLIIGMKEPTPEERQRKVKWRIEPISPEQEQSKDKNGLSPWIAQVTRVLLAFLGSPPRVQIIPISEVPGQHAAGVVCLIATARAPSLVPVLVKGQDAYYFRIEDQNKAIPPTLVADLLLGRRVAPWIVPSAEPLAVEPRQFTYRNKQGHLQYGNGACFRFKCRVMNDSLVDNDSVSIGIVVPQAIDHTEAPPFPLPLTLSSAVEFIEDADSELPMKHAPRHVRLKWSVGSKFQTELMAFDSASTSYGEEFVIGHLPNDPARQALCALYVLPRGCPPQWFQVRLQVHGRSIAATRRFEASPTPAIVEIRIERIAGVRPIVSPDRQAPPAEVENWND